MYVCERQRDHVCTCEKQAVINGDSERETETERDIETVSERERVREKKKLCVC